MRASGAPFGKPVARAAEPSTWAKRGDVAERRFHELVEEALQCLRRLSQVTRPGAMVPLVQISKTKPVEVGFESRRASPRQCRKPSSPG